MAPASRHAMSSVNLGMRLCPVSGLIESSHNYVPYLKLCSRLLFTQKPQDLKSQRSGGTRQGKMATLSTGRCWLHKGIPEGRGPEGLERTSSLGRLIAGSLSSPGFCPKTFKQEFPSGSAASLHEDADSIPGLAQWVKDQALP